MITLEWSRSVLRSVVRHQIKLHFYFAKAAYTGRVRLYRQFSQGMREENGVKEADKQTNKPPIGKRNRIC